MPTVSYGIANTAEDVTYIPGIGLEPTTPGAGINGGFPFIVGLRFLGVAVPQGATISSATLLLTKSSVSGTVWGSIKGVDSDNAPAWTTTDPSAASKTTQSVTVFDGTTQSYTVTAIVQAIVNRSGWSSGSALAFAGDPTGADGLMQWVDYGANPAQAAQLSITYSTGPVTLNTLTLTASVVENANNGTLAGTVSGRTSGSTLSLVGSPPFAIDSATGQVTKNGSLVYTSSPYSITVRETLAGATNTPNDTVLSVTVTQSAPISYPSAGATGTNTATMPTHQAGDLIRVYAFRDGSNTPPSLVAGYTSLSAPTGTQTCSHRIAEKVATSNAETVGTWTNATSVIVRIYRPGTGYSFTAGNGAVAVGTGTGTTVTYPTVTLNNTGGTSWVDCAAGHRSVNTTLETPPTGTVFRVGVVDATDEAASFDTNGGVTSWTSKAVSVGGTSSGWTATSAEIRVLSAGGTTYTLSAEKGTFTLSGQAANLNTTRTLQAQAGSYTLTGRDANLLRGYTLQAESGSYALTGQAANLNTTRTLQAEAGSYTLTGQAANLNTTRTLQAQAGSFVLTGRDAVFPRSRRLEAEAGSYSLTGRDATLIYVSAGVTYTLQAEVGTFSLSGKDATFRRSIRLEAESGNYTLLGQEAEFTFVPAAKPQVVTFIIG